MRRAEFALSDKDSPTGTMGVAHPRELIVDEKDNLMTKNTIRSIVAVLAAGFVLCGTARSYAEDCYTTCANGANDVSPAADAELCNAICDAFCTTEGSPVSTCWWKEEIVKKAPAVTQWGYAVLIVFVLGGAGWVFRRKTASAA